MKYKEGDTIFCSVSSSSLDPRDHFVVTIVMVRDHDYRAAFQFTHNAEPSPSTFTDFQLEKFSKNYLTAMSPLGKALS